MKFCVSQVRLVELGFKLIPHRFECQPIGYRLGFADLSQVVVQLVVLRKVYVFVIAQRHFDFLSDGCLAVAYVYVWPFANISTVLAEVRGDRFNASSRTGNVLWPPPARSRPPKT